VPPWALRLDVLLLLNGPAMRDHGGCTVAGASCHSSLAITRADAAGEKQSVPHTPPEPLHRVFGADAMQTTRRPWGGAQAMDALAWPCLLTTFSSENLRK